MEHIEGVTEQPAGGVIGPERVSVVLDQQLYLAVQHAAWSDDRPMSAWIRVAIREKLERGNGK